MLVKVCGIADPANARAIAALGPDMMGFIFYAPSPRNALGLEPSVVKDLPDGIEKIGVFVDEPEAFITFMARRYGLGGVQLHGNESPDVCRRLREKELKVIKAFGIGAPDDLHDTTRYEGCCDMFVFDTKTPLKGGAGVKFDHRIIRDYSGATPFLLSGGIGPGDEALFHTPPHGLCLGADINSRFETSPGMKDEALVGRFIENMRKL